MLMVKSFMTGRHDLSGATEQEVLLYLRQYNADLGNWSENVPYLVVVIIAIVIQLWLMRF